MNARIPYTKPSITDLEIDYVNDAIRHGWGENCYDYIRKFESAFKNYLKVDFSVATSSCTGALHMGLAAMGIGPGDEVILAEANWIATVAPIVQLGATPVFVDILEDSWCINPQMVKRSITKKTKAIIVTHLYGNLAEMNELIEIGESKNIPIIEDSAESLGSMYFKKFTGTLGYFGVFSFHGTKTATTGEGGMFVTNNEALYEKVLTLSNHGRVRGEVKQFWPELIGFKYKLSNIQAALGYAQILRLDELVTRKREIMNYYLNALGNRSELSFNIEHEYTRNSYWMPTIVFAQQTGIRRDRIISIFEQNQIDARNFFWPLSSLPMFYKNEKDSIADSISSRAVNLPSFYDISTEDLDRVIYVINKLLES